MVAVTPKRSAAIRGPCELRHKLGEPDAILICVPTPLAAAREPDLGYVVRATEAIAACLRPGQLVVLESTTYPGTTRDVVRPILEAFDGNTSSSPAFVSRHWDKARMTFPGTRTVRHS